MTSCRTCDYGFFFSKGTFDAFKGKKTKKDELYCAKKNRFRAKKTWKNGCPDWRKRK